MIGSRCPLYQANASNQHNKSILKFFAIFVKINLLKIIFFRYFFKMD